MPTLGGARMSNRSVALTARTGNEPWLAGGAMGDVLEGLKKEGHITGRQYVAGLWLLDEMRKSHGTSAGLIPQLGERVDTSRMARLFPPGGGDPDSFARMEIFLDGLRQHERELLGFLIVHKERTRGSLADWGRGRSAYEHGRSARAFTTGQISAALSSLAEIAGVPADDSVAAEHLTR